MVLKQKTSHQNHKARFCKLNEILVYCYQDNPGMFLYYEFISLTAAGDVFKYVFLRVFFRLICSLTVSVLLPRCQLFISLKHSNTVIK